jgi:uncharacterized protein
LHREWCRGIGNPPALVVRAEAVIGFRPSCPGTTFNDKGISRLSFFLLFIGLGVGLAIGCTGVGGVLLVPLLTYGLGLGVQGAIAVALWSYGWSGLVAVLLYARRASIDWRMARWLCLAAVPGAFLGARATALLPDAALEALIALLLVASGLHALHPRRTETPAARHLGRAGLMMLGGITGFGAALVGGGGAFIVVPLLAVLEQPPLIAIGLGQTIQIPISATASLANLAGDRIDLTLGTVLAAALALGIAVGAPLAHALPQQTLRRVLAFAMLAAGFAMLANLAARAVSML